MPTAFPLGTQSSQEAHRPSGTQGSPGAAPVPTSARRREHEGGRHGRISFPESAADSAIRSRLVRLAAVPCLLVAVTGAAVTAFVVQAGGAQLGSREWAVLSGGLTLICVIVLTAGAAANSEARATVTRYARLRHVCARSQSDLYDLLDRVRQGEWTPHRDPDPELVPTGDTLDLLAHEVAAAGRAAEAAVIDAVAIARSNATGSEQKVEVFVNLARRLQSLVHREIELLDELENQVEDPDLLKGLFHIDHLATRIRRHAENLAVLGGAISRRQWSRPVSMTEVLRSSIAEVEQYPRVKLVPPIEGTLRGHAVADVIHLLAELVENASIYSAPQTNVLLRAQLVTAGLAVEVEDRGLGMSAEEQTQMNALLADPEHIDVAELLSDGRIGLFVVSSLARRHGIVVKLQSNIYGGVQAVLVLPQELLGAESSRAAAARTGSPDSDPAREHDDGHDDWPDDWQDLCAEPGSGSRDSVPGPDADRALEAPRRGHDHQSVTSRAESSRAGDVDGEHGSGTTHSRAVPARDSVTGRDDGPADPGPVVLPPPPAPLDNSIRPRLPRRRKQEHLVPELRGEPILPSATRRTEPEPMADPGLMAAFQRGFGLADETYKARRRSQNTPGDNGNAAGQGDRGSAGGAEPFYDRDHDAPMTRPRGDDPNHGE
ncbi:sensor histidine kinase [Streptomyces piniterrae]|uniref:histidine kinase n=1 Tax=Streptomyces piniterrae TaxID=2571125 RepID=A0A4V5MND6_9ACTN|nr:ATP-binding protein [Streptomyces piniterrae]TJZ56958.1 sensor histidine kinase [Streptomyces piniterrae]